MVRNAICAGTWYPNEEVEIQAFLNPKAKRQKVIAGICPHAGWVYSGATAGEVYSTMEPTELYIIIGPNHYGLGLPISVFPDQEWETPLGNLKVNTEVVDAIISESKHIKPDRLAHSREHCLEVQLPFIKLISPDAKIVPIAMADYNANTCKNVGLSIANVIKEKKLGDKTTLISSTDMSHYLPDEYAKKLDNMAIEKILKLDPDGLLKVVRKEQISMCGSGPTATVLWAAKELGAKTAELIKYSNSGQITGDTHQVVGYAGIIIK